MEEEIWKEIENYEGLYEVSSWGRVKGLRFGKEKILYSNVHRQGYLKVTLIKEKKRIHFFIHRLVAIAFIPNPNNYPMVLHKVECYPSNNNVNNLFWGTGEINMKDMINKGRGKSNPPKGEKQYLSKLTEKQVLEIRAKYTGMKGQQALLAKEYGVHQATISDIITRRTWKHI